MNRRRGGPPARALAALLVAWLLAGCAPSPTPAVPLVDTQPASAAETEPDVDAVTQIDTAALPAVSLADGLLPPTNRWYSGLVFHSQPAFPLPLGVSLTDAGFAVGLPQVQDSADTIYASFRPNVEITLGARDVVVVSDNPLVLDLGGQGRLTLAQGVPFVTFTADDDVMLVLPDAFTAAGNGLAVATVAGTQYAVAWQDGHLAGSSLVLLRGGVAAVWAVPEGTEPEALRDAALSVVTGAEVTYQVTATAVTTRITYQTSDGTGAVARMPHQTGGECALGEYPSAYGTLRLCAGTTVEWTAPRVTAASGLALDGIDSAQRAAILEQLAVDAAAPGEFPADTYFGGKALQRQALLLSVARELGADELADQIADRLEEELRSWTESDGCAQRTERCFAYNTADAGMVGFTPAFGSEEFNDHHFHWGYFLFAGAVLAEYRPEVAADLAPVLDLLAADIAGAGGASFPAWRVFDPYAGHSWASGTAPFADGNNQESVSEAVNAWAGVQLWAQARGDDARADRAAWMLSLEAAASDAYWLESDLSAFPAYAHGIVSLNWGGKRDYATWFSPEPAAKLGILVLPAGPTAAAYLGGDAQRIRANVAEAVGSGASADFAQAFGDYALMYLALAGEEDRARAWEEALALPDDVLDDGLTRTYLLAWIAAAGST